MPRCLTILPPEPWLSWGLALAFSAAATAAHLIWGPFPVLHEGVYIDEPTPLPYLVLVFVPFGLLVGELCHAALRGRHSLERLRMGASGAVILAILCGLALARLVLRISLSGHALMATFFLAHEMADRHPRSRARLMAGALLATQVLYYKLWFWRDPPTLLAGIAAGLLTWAVTRRGLGW